MSPQHGPITTQMGHVHVCRMFHPDWEEQEEEQEDLEEVMDELNRERAVRRQVGRSVGYRPP